MEDQATFDPGVVSGGARGYSKLIHSLLVLHGGSTYLRFRIVRGSSKHICLLLMEDLVIFDPDLVHAIFKLIWNKRTQERERNEGIEIFDNEAGTGVSKKNRPTTANANALKLSCELLRLFVAEAVQRAATISDAECVNKIEATHLERILPQLLLDF